MAPVQFLVQLALACFNCLSPVDQSLNDISDWRLIWSPTACFAVSSSQTGPAHAAVVSWLLLPPRNCLQHLGDAICRQPSSENGIWMLQRCIDLCQLYCTVARSSTAQSLGDYHLIGIGSKHKENSQPVQTRILERRQSQMILCCRVYSGGEAGGAWAIVERQRGAALSPPLISSNTACPPEHPEYSDLG